MIPLYSQEEYDSSTSKCLLLVRCYQCNTAFSKQKQAITKVLRGVPGHSGMFCSPQCFSAFKVAKFNVTVSCRCCEKEFSLLKTSISKSGNNFCSKSCSATFNNKNKTHGTRRSKLEAWIESQLTSLYPNLEIHFNRKDAIGSELDIYIPSLRLAFELNGIFHYEPIYGSMKLEQTQNNDSRKFQDCLAHGISLCIIDTSGQKYFKPKTSQKYLDIIASILSG